MVVNKTILTGLNALLEKKCVKFINKFSLNGAIKISKKEIKYQKRDYDTLLKKLSKCKVLSGVK